MIITIFTFHSFNIIRIALIIYLKYLFEDPKGQTSSIYSREIEQGRGLSHSGIGDEVKVGGDEWVCAEVLQGDVAVAWVEGGVVVAWVEGGVVVAWSSARIRVEVEVGGGAEVLEGGVVVAWAAARIRVEVEVGGGAEVLEGGVVVAEGDAGVG